MELEIKIQFKSLKQSIQSYLLKDLEWSKNRRPKRVAPVPLVFVLLLSCSGSGFSVMLHASVGWSSCLGSSSVRSCPGVRLMVDSKMSACDRERERERGSERVMKR